MHLNNSQPLTFEFTRLGTADSPPNVTRNFNWNRSSGEFLLVFDTFRNGGQPSEALKVMQGADVLYDIPLQALIEQGKEISKRLTRVGAEMTVEQLPCSGIAKVPSIALRYNLPTGLVRRIQFRFASAAEYDKAYNQFRRLGLHVSEGRDAPPSSKGSITCPPTRLASRPHTANQSTPTLSHTQFQAGGGRPFSAQPCQSSPLRDQVFPRPGTAASSASYEDLQDFPQGQIASTSRPSLDYSSIGTLPPRRELPFQRTDSPPVSRGSDSSSRPDSRSTNAFMAPPPLPPPSRGGAVCPSSRAKSSHGDDLPPLPTPTIVSNPANPSPMKKLNTGMRAPSHKGAKYSRPLPAASADKENQTFASTSSGRRPSAGLGHDGSRPLSASRSFSAISEAAQNERQFQALNSNEPSDEDNANGISQMAAYAAQPEDIRMDALNESLIQYLDDPNFMTLLGDLEASLARIMPGSGSDLPLTMF